jgi:PAS domain S-box-containing protein
MRTNQAFTNNFGYTNDEIKGKNFSILFNEKDRLNIKPQKELVALSLHGQAQDENYIINKNGQQIWCTGESIVVANIKGEKFIVKDIVNLQSKKQLQLFLNNTDEILETIFNSSTDIPMMILDGGLKIQKVNKGFLDMFELAESPIPGSRLTDLPHPFWKSTEIKSHVSKIIINQEALREKQFSITTKSGENKRIQIDSKIMDKHTGSGRKIFIIVEDITLLDNLNSGGN